MEDNVNIIDDVKKAWKGREDTEATPTDEAGVIGYYFAASWCVRCRASTQLLKTTYAALTPARKFVIVHCSRDRNESAFREHCQGMPWPSLDYTACRDTIVELQKKYEVKKMPTLVMVDAGSGRVINPNALDWIQKDTQLLHYPWKK